MEISFFGSSERKTRKLQFFFFITAVGSNWIKPKILDCFEQIYKFEVSDFMLSILSQ